MKNKATVLYLCPCCSVPASGLMQPWYRFAKGPPTLSIPAARGRDRWSSFQRWHQNAWARKVFYLHSPMPSLTVLIFYSFASGTAAVSPASHLCLAAGCLRQSVSLSSSKSCVTSGSCAGSQPCSLLYQYRLSSLSIARLQRLLWPDGSEGKMACAAFLRPLCKHQELCFKTGRSCLWGQRSWPTAHMGMKQQHCKEHKENLS